ncbi:hypothetical protein GCM10017774_40660 [Lentzea cavernae]|uniref:Uncharacterized protein n=1 Tax=Lentzea cavernae TaxID=2020703 RepID=A0ABQ3MH08_9PSEU|nr:hypothetical protein GCM10017774_40660 [Lentzea cavernae]
MVSGVVVVTGGGVVVTGADEDGGTVVEDVAGVLWLAELDVAARLAAAPVGSTG